MFMSSASMRGLLCLAVAFAMFAGVGIWTYQQTRVPVAIVTQSGILPKSNHATVPGKQPTPNIAPPKGNLPNAVALQPVEEAAPFNDPPRFFQKGGGKGFGRKTTRANLSDRLGVRLQKPSEDMVLQLGIADTDGLVIEDMRDNSLAQSVGMKVGDILLTLDGQNVPSDVDQFHFQLENLKTNEAIDAVILRDGKMETFKGLVLPEAPPRSFPFQRKFFDN
jgi:hypothetical protein